MTTPFTQRLAAFALTLVTSALLVAGAVGPAQPGAGHAAVAAAARLVA